MDLVGCVHRNKNRTDLRSCPECQEPCGDVCCPHGHVVAGLHTHGDECGGNTVHIASEFLVGPRVIEGRVFEGILVGIKLNHLVQDISERSIDHFILLPWESSGMRAVLVQSRALRPLSGNPREEVREVRENDIGIRNILVPVHREESFVVQRPESLQEIINRKSALSHQDIPSVEPVADSHIADVGTQGLDGGLGALVAIEEGLTDVPGSTDRCRCKSVDDLKQILGFRKRTDGLEQNAHILFLSPLDCRCHLGMQSFNIGHGRDMDNHILNPCKGSHIHILDKRNRRNRIALNCIRIRQGTDLDIVVALHDPGL